MDPLPSVEDLDYIFTAGPYAVYNKIKYNAELRKVFLLNDVNREFSIRNTVPFDLTVSELGEFLELDPKTALATAINFNDSRVAHGILRNNKYLGGEQLNRAVFGAAQRGNDTMVAVLLKFGASEQVAMDGRQYS